MGPVEEDVGAHGSRMGHPEGARTVALSSNGLIYLIVLSFVFLHLCINDMPALCGHPTCNEGGTGPLCSLAAPLLGVPNTLGCFKTLAGQGVCKRPDFSNAL